jgi:thioesterase domain-containing protein/acyl carrier protein
MTRAGVAGEPLSVASGSEDPRLCEVDDEFRELIVKLQFMAKIARIKKSRFLHPAGVLVQGTLRVLETAELPDHLFFRPGRSWPVIARYSNGGGGDDAVPDLRGVALRLLTWSAPNDWANGLFDLTMNTGETFFARSASVFARFQHEVGDPETLIREIPEIVPRFWRMIRTATSYSTYHYYSQTAHILVDLAGRQWLARFRLVPQGAAADDSAYDHGERILPPAGGEPLPRAPGDTRSPTCLRDQLRASVASGGVHATLQLQLRAIEDAASNEAALDCSAEWPTELYPWKDLAELRLDSVADISGGEELSFNPGRLPAGMALPLAQSPHQAASVNHLRVLSYRIGAAARRGEKLPPELATILRPRETPVRVTAGSTPADAAPAARPRRVCIVGAGATGLSIARALEQNGHHAIVLEREPNVAGKCGTLTVDQRPYDLGGHICTQQYKQLARLLVELDVETEAMTPYRVYDMDERRSSPQSGAFFERSLFQRYTALRSREFPRIGEPGMAHSARALGEPVGRWLERNRIEALARSLGVGYTSAGYGYLQGDLPALYFAKYAEMTGLVSMDAELLGHAGGFTIRGGFQSLWQRVASRLRDVRCGVNIRSIERDASGVRVHTDGEEVVADDLVLTVPMQQMLPLLDPTGDEKDIASRIRYFTYYTTVAAASGLPRSAFYLVDQHSRNPALRGHFVSFHHRHADRDVYTFYSYGGETIDEREIPVAFEADIAHLGGQLGEVHLRRRWAFMPHFGSEDVLGGVYDRIEEMQGQQHTYYAGSLPAFELVECNVSYAQALVRRYFPELGTRAPEQAIEIRKPATSAPRAQISVETLQAWLVSQVAVNLQVPESTVEADAPLERYPLDSLSIAALLGELGDWLGWRVPPTLFLELPSLSAIAHQLAEAHRDGGAERAPAAAPSDPLLVALQPPRPLFCVGGAFGSVHYLLPLARALGGGLPFYGLQAPGLDGKEAPIDSIEELAARYLQAIRQVQPHGPYVLAGHSFGGVVAYEMGRQLRARREEVQQIILLDSYLPLPGQSPPPEDEAAALEEMQTMHRLLLGATAESEPTATVAQRLEQLGQALGLPADAAVGERLAGLLAVYQSNLEAFVAYEAATSDLPVTLVKADGGFPPVLKDERQVHLFLENPQNGWDRLALPNLRVLHVAGNHFDMFVEPNLVELADALRASVDVEKEEQK